jgi:Predicted aspartyl protease
VNDGIRFYTPFSAAWTVDRLRDANPARAMSILRTWAHPRRHRELTPATVREIAALNDDQAQEALQELKLRRSFVRGRKGNTLTVPVVLKVAGKTHTVEALVDSGCEGSCLHQDLVSRLTLPTQKLPRPIPVLNADGKPNVAGPIKETVTAEMVIGSHMEKIAFGVTNLGTSSLFLGYDWLTKHNPVVDWTKNTMSMDNCLCARQVVQGDIETDNNPKSGTRPLQEGEQILLVDPTEAIRVRATSNPATRLAEEAARKAEREGRPIAEIPAFLADYTDVFRKKEFDRLPERRPWDHAIELIPGTEPKLSCKIYPLSSGEQEKLDEFLDEQIHTGRIRPSKSPMASPFFFIKKKDGSLRPVQDYRKLNEITVKNRYPLPLINELIDQLRGARYYTKLDIRWGYNNVRIKEGDEYKAAFRTNRGLYEPLVMFFGLTNSPATFQTMMNDILKEEIDTGTVLVYLDDILIFGNDHAKHRQQVRRVLEILRRHKLYLKLEKCEFEKKETEYLGVIVSEGSVRMDPVKTQGVADWPEPRNKKDVQSFLDFAIFTDDLSRTFPRSPALSLN